MKEVVLPVASRANRGKGVARQLRRSGKVPATLYGPKIDPRNLSVELTDLEALLRSKSGSTVMLALDLDGAGTTDDRALIRSMQRDPVYGEILHIDFHQVPMDRPIHLTIPVRLIGTPEGVKTHGGIMQQIIRELEVSCLPTQIPDAVELDVSELDIQGSIHVSAITLENATILTDTRSTIVTILPPTVSTETTDEEGAEDAAEGTDEATETTDGDSKESEGSSS